VTWLLPEHLPFPLLCQEQQRSVRHPLFYTINMAWSSAIFSWALSYAFDNHGAGVMEDRSVTHNEIYNYDGAVHQVCMVGLRTTSSGKGLGTYWLRSGRRVKQHQAAWAVARVRDRVAQKQK
jgi:hypothetical protein